MNYRDLIIRPRHERNYKLASLISAPALLILLALALIALESWGLL